MKKIIKTSASLLFVLFLTVLTAALIMSSKIPESFFVTEGERFCLNNNLISEKVAAAGSTVEDMKKDNSYRVNLSLLGILPIKDVNVDVVESVKVQPLGTLFGAKMFTDGVLVIDINSVDGESGSTYPAREAGIKVGDIIISVNGEDINTSDELFSAIAECENGKAKIQLDRNGKRMTINAQAVLSRSDGCYHLGAWVRDSTAGIGTMTFYLPEYKLMAGLGHGICDVDTNELMPLLSGETVSVEVTDIVKGSQGTPGEIKGSFSDSEITGRLIMNAETGIYAASETDPKRELTEIAMKQDIKEGPAQILSELEGHPEYYDIEIERVNINSDSPVRNMVIRITDEHLLELTGGIIQGMSGSPVLQNGKLIGAVTHVFINDPTRGYAIFAENMLASIKESAENAA